MLKDFMLLKKLWDMGGHLPLPHVPAAATALKRTVSQVSLLALGVVFELASRYVPEMKDEISSWEDGRRVAIGVMPSGPFITILKEGRAIHYLGRGLKDPELAILFKNLDSAVMIFTGQMGAPQAVAENRVVVHGSNVKAMEVTRAMAIVQTYLFPGFILDKTFKRPPRLSLSQMALKGKIMGLLTPRLMLVAAK
jgi:hypothetical protein